ncbi:MAG: tetratricopeptide repeat protein, partial [Vulcanimicrobiota bacterium]
MSNGFEEYVSEAQSLAAGGDTEGAIEMYKAALTENPTSEEVHREIINLTLEKHDFQQVIVEYFDWAEACQVDGEIDDAIRIYQEILELDSILHSKMEGYDPESVQEAISQIQEIIESASGAIFFNMGYLYMEKNSLDEAVSSLQKSLEYNASDAKTHALLGQVFMQKELDKEAIGEFQEVVRLAPDEAAYAYEMLGEIFIRSGKPPQSTVVWFRNAGDLYVRHQQYEEAIRAYERILSFEPDNKDVILRLGEIHAEQGNSQRAFEIYRDLAEIYKNDGLLDKVIGVYEKLLEWDPENTEARQKIIEIYQKILEMDPSNLSARSKLISNILRKGNPEEAVPEFLALSKTYLEKGMRKEAFAVCKKLLELDPKNEKAHELIADIFYDQGAKDKALPEYLMVIKLYQEQNDEEELNRINEKVNKRFPGTKEVTYKLAQAYVEKGEYDLALAEYQKVLNQEPANLDILTAMLEILEKKEDNENVIKFAERIITLAPSRTGIQEKIIKIYEKSGNNEKLLDYYRKILENEPERNDIRDKILDIYERTSKTDEALSLYKEILEADPERVDVRQKMIEHYASAGEIEKVLSQSSALADIFLNSEDFDKAEGLYKNVLAFMPGDVTIRERLCNIYKARDEEEKVKEELLVLANVNSRENKLGSSIEYCRNILEYNPDDLSIKLRIADNASKMGDTDQAVEQFKEVANIYIDKKMTQPAIVTIENILEVDEQNVVYRQKLITILKDQLRIEETIRHYKILIQHFLRMKQNDEAIIAAKDAIALLPMDLELRRDLVELFLEEDDVENGRAFSEELINLHLDRSEYQEVIDIHQRISQIYKDKEDLGTYFEYREKIAQVYEKQAKFHDAINEYIAILEGNLETSNTAEAQRLFPVIIDLYLKEERPSEAVDCFREISRKLHDSNKVEEAILVLEQMVGIEKRIEKFDSALEVL